MAATISPRERRRSSCVLLLRRSELQDSIAFAGNLCAGAADTPLFLLSRGSGQEDVTYHFVTESVQTKETRAGQGTFLVLGLGATSRISTLKPLTVSCPARTREDGQDVTDSVCFAISLLCL